MQQHEIQKVIQNAAYLKKGNIKNMLRTMSVHAHTQTLPFSSLYTSFIALSGQKCNYCTGHAYKTAMQQCVCVCAFCRLHLI